MDDKSSMRGSWKPRVLRSSGTKIRTMFEKSPGSTCGLDQPCYHRHVDPPRPGQRWYPGQRPRLGWIPRGAHFTQKCLTTLVTGGPTIPNVARRHDTTRNVHSESTNRGTVLMIILINLTKPTRKHNQIISSNPINPQQEETQFSQTAP